MADMVVEPGAPQERWAEHAPPPITEVEQYGIEPIPPADRTAILYVAALLLFPEPRAVYGPEGPRFVRASDAEPPPIVAAPGGARAG